MRELILLTADKPNGHRLDGPRSCGSRRSSIRRDVEQRVTQWYKLVHIYATGLLAKQNLLQRNQAMSASKSYDLGQMTYLATI